MAEENEELTGEALDKRTTELEIEGRSEMSADQKRKAVAKAEKEGVAEDHDQEAVGKNDPDSPAAHATPDEFPAGSGVEREGVRGYGDSADPHPGRGRDGDAELDRKVTERVAEIQADEEELSLEKAKEIQAVAQRVDRALRQVISAGDKDVARRVATLIATIELLDDIRDED